MDSGHALICPQCRGSLSSVGSTLKCETCAQEYRVVDGIPDLRIAPDPWIGMAEDREKGLLLDREAPPGFEAAVRKYWEMTPATSGPAAARHIDHVLQSGARTREWLESVVPPPWAGEEWLDLGCGTADLAVAVPPVIQVTGLDIAFRWLVVARRRMRDAGRSGVLVCGNAEALPFPDGSFDRVVALGTVEHCADIDLLLREARRVLKPGGRLHLRTTNRFSLLPEPHVGLFGVSWLPHGLADRYVRWRGGRGYEHHWPRGPGELARALRRAGFRQTRISAARMLQTERGRLPSLFRPLVPVYEAVRSTPGLNLLTRAIAPMLELEGVAP